MTAAIEHNSGLVTGDDSPKVARTNTMLLRTWLSAGETVCLPGGRLAIGAPGIVVGQNNRAVSFSLSGNGSQVMAHARPGHGPTILHRVGLWRGPDEAILTIGGPQSGGHYAGRRWSVRDIRFERRADRGKYNTPYDGIAAWQADSATIQGCVFHNLRNGIRLQPREKSRIVSVSVRDCETQRNRRGIFACGKPPKGASTHCGLKIDCCNSVLDRVGLHVTDFWNGLKIDTYTVHRGLDHGVLIERSQVRIDTLYAEAGGKRGRNTLTVRDGSRVGVTGAVALYMDVDETSTVHATPPYRFDAVTHNSQAATYGRTETPSTGDPRFQSGGYTALPGSKVVDEDGVAWRCVEGGYGVKPVWEPMEVLP